MSIPMDLPSHTQIQNISIPQKLCSYSFQLYIVSVSRWGWWSTHDTWVSPWAHVCVMCVHLSFHPTLSLSVCKAFRLGLSLSLSGPPSFLIIPHSVFISPLTGSNILLLIAEYDFMRLVLNSKGRGGNTYISLCIKAVNYITFYPSGLS